MGQKFFARFLGELKKTKCPFEINWPLGKWATEKFQGKNTKIGKMNFGKITAQQLKLIGKINHCLDRIMFVSLIYQDM